MTKLIFIALLLSGCEQFRQNFDNVGIEGYSKTSAGRFGGRVDLHVRPPRDNSKGFSK